MKITFLGQCGFLLEGNAQRIVIDPYLSDFLDKNFSKEDVQWKRLFPPPTSLTCLNPDVILISHKHYDHLDPWTIRPYIEAGGKALFVAPYAAKERLEKQGVKNVCYIDAGETMKIGDCSIRAIACAHMELHVGSNGHYRELSYGIEESGNRILFAGDMMLRAGLEEEVRALACQLLLLPCNGRDAWRDAHNIVGNMTAEEAAAFAKNVGASMFIPMHHDLYDINRCNAEEIRVAAQKNDIAVCCMQPMECLQMQQGKIIRKIWEV